MRDRKTSLNKPVIGVSKVNARPNSVTAIWYGEGVSPDSPEKGDLLLEGDGVAKVYTGSDWSAEEEYLANGVRLRKTPVIVIPEPEAAAVRPFGFEVESTTEMDGDLKIGLYFYFPESPEPHELPQGVEVDWGDETSSDVGDFGEAEVFEAGFVVPLEHVYADEGPYTVVVSGIEFHDAPYLLDAGDYEDFGDLLQEKAKVTLVSEGTGNSRPVSYLVGDKLNQNYETVVAEMPRYRITFGTHKSSEDQYFLTLQEAMSEDVEFVVEGPHQYIALLEGAMVNERDIYIPFATVDYETLELSPLAQDGVFLGTQGIYHDNLPLKVWYDPETGLGAIRVDGTAYDAGEVEKGSGISLLYQGAADSVDEYQSIMVEYGGGADLEIISSGGPFPEDDPK